MFLIVNQTPYQITFRLKTSLLKFYKLIKVDTCIFILDENFFMKLLLHGNGKYDNKMKPSLSLVIKPFDGQLI